MPTPYDTEEWELSCFLDWRPKSKTVPCDRCNGEGTIGGGFKDIEGTRTCPDCFGRGSKGVVLGKGQKPELPPELVEHMRRAWWDFMYRGSKPAENSTLPEKSGA